MKKASLVTGILLIICVLMSASFSCNAGEGSGQQTTILENGYYFNGKSFTHFAEMILKNGKIASIEPVVTKTSGDRVALYGKYIIPGLIDAHMHINGSPAYPYVVGDAKLNTNSSLSCGVTTLIDLFYRETGCAEMKKQTAQSPELYSSLLMAGPILTAPGGHGTEYGVPTRTITSVEEARKITNEVIDGGADVIKLAYEADKSNYIPSITKEMVAAIVQAAHKRKIKVFAHIDRAAQAVDCAEVGVDVLAHMPGDALTDEQLNKLKSSGVIIIPTISILQSALEGHDAKYMSDSLLWKTANPAFMDNFHHAALSKMPIPEEMIRKFYPSVHFYENLQNCIKMKIPILAGTDAGNYATFYGYSLHNELIQYVKAGMSNAQAVASATENIKLVFPSTKIGKIAPGYDADIVVLNADPLTDIENTKNINMVFHKGKLAKNLITELITAANNAPKTPVAAVDPTVLDFSKSENLPPNISVFSDEKFGGSSTITSALQKGADGNNQIHLTGKIVKKGYLGFAGLSFSLNPKDENSPVDISGYTTIEADIKGNGAEYFLSLISSLVKDYNFHSFTITPTKDWQTIHVPITDFKQRTRYGNQISLNPATILSINFTAAGKDMDVDLDVRNVRLVK